MLFCENWSWFRYIIVQKMSFLRNGTYKMSCIVGVLRAILWIQRRQSCMLNWSHNSWLQECDWRKYPCLHLPPTVAVRAYNHESLCVRISLTLSDKISPIWFTPRLFFSSHIMTWLTERSHGSNARYTHNPDVTSMCYRFARSEWFTRPFLNL